MSAIVVKCKVPKMGDKEVSVSYDFGDNLAEATSLFGEEVVFSAFKGDAVISLQGRMRDWAMKGKNDAEITELVGQWKPGVVLRTGGDPVKRYEDFFSNLLETGDEEKATEQIRKLEALIAAKKAAKG